MPKPHPQRDLSTSRPARAPSALTSAQSHAARGVRSCLRLAAAPDETARRRSRVEEVLAAGRLTIDCERDGVTHTITVFGELDVATAAGLQVELMAVEATDATQIVLDLSGVTFIDSGAVRLIARADARCTTAAKRLRLLRGPPHIQRVFALVGANALPFADDCVASRLRARRDGVPARASQHAMTIAAAGPARTELVDIGKRSHGFCRWRVATTLEASQRELAAIDKQTTTEPGRDDQARIDVESITGPHAEDGAPRR